MGRVDRLFGFLNRSPSSFAPISIQAWQHGQAQFPDLRYDTFAREGYQKSPIVYGCIEELATSAAEPRMQQRNGRTWNNEGVVVDLLRAPNRFMDGFELWATVIMHLSLAGNAYGLMIRSESGRVLELWLLRPDRVRVIPDSVKYISGYEYDVGSGRPVILPEEDVIHWRKRHPLDDFYGMPPLLAASGATDLDNFMRDFVKAFFMNAGVPGGLLNVEGELAAAARTEIKDGFKTAYGGPRGWHSLMIVENHKASFTPMTANLGASGLVVPELRDLTDSEICTVFGVPQSLVGTRISYMNGGYANKRAEEQHFWTGTLAPLYKELAGPLNLKLIPNFPRIAEVRFDLSDVRALQEDVDKVHARAVQALISGGITIEEFRDATGAGDLPSAGTLLVPANLVATPLGTVGELPLAIRAEAVGALIRAGFEPEGALRVMGLPVMPHLGLPPVTVQAPATAEVRPAPNPNGNMPAMVP